MIFLIGINISINTLMNSVKYNIILFLEKGKENKEMLLDILA